MKERRRPEVSSESELCGAARTRSTQQSHRRRDGKRLHGNRLQQPHLEVSSVFGQHLVVAGRWWRLETIKLNTNPNKVSLVRSRRERLL